MTILRYHGYSDWSVRHTISDDLNKDFTLGFELEVTKDGTHSCTTSPERLATLIKNKFGDLFVCERDGSIGNGVEIISQPMTWNYFDENQSIFKELLELCVNNGFDSHKGNKCGLHVHIGRKGLRQYNNIHLDETNTTINIDYILERYQKEFFKFSRRTRYSWERWTTSYTGLIETENGSDFIDKDLIKAIVKNNRRNSRYVSLNLTNEKTIEFRFLRGTLKWSTFYISMNLIKNIVNEAKISDNVLTFKHLVLKDLSPEWTDIANEYCQNRGIDLSDENQIVIKLEKTSKNHASQMIVDKYSLYNELCEE